MEFSDDLLFAELGHLQLYNESLFQKNFSDHYNGTDALLPTGVKVTIVVVYMIVCVIGLVGNFLVMYVIIRLLGYVFSFVKLSAGYKMVLNVLT
ncbi:Mu-type opioid receptor [Channa argus]|uniref:Mu-type opioid receptor n=1 Tax=Channa argus TaxID=215402 RepID=A0A6G1Q4Y2_CHAAH|nr:Mu-type opioid receptor [Channa argus]